MDRTSALIFAGIAITGIVVALIKGDAAAGRGISRKDDSTAFWFLLFVYAVVAVVMLYVAWQAT